MKVVIGIDPSFSSTGIAVVHDNEQSIVKDGSLLKSYIVTHCRPKVKFNKVSSRFTSIFEYVNYEYMVPGIDQDLELIKTQNIIEATKAILSIILPYKNQGYNIVISLIIIVKINDLY